MSWELALRFDEPPPLDIEWNFTFGEAVHNLRSSLDNAAVSIGRHAGIIDQKLLKRIQFPISATPADWANDKSRIKRLPAEYQAAIEAIQPFQRGTALKDLEQDALLILRDLHNQDKHHLQATAALQPADLAHQTSVEFETEEGAAASIPPDVEVFTPAFENGELLLRQRTRGRIAKVKGSHSVVMQVQVVLPDGRQLGMTHLLAGLCEYVRQVLAHVGAAGTTPTESTPA